MPKCIGVIISMRFIVHKIVHIKLILVNSVIDKVIQKNQLDATMIY